MFRLIRWHLYGRKAFVNYIQGVSSEQELRSLGHASLCICGKKFYQTHVVPLVNIRLQELGLRTL